MAEAARIANGLQNTYGALGLAVDQTTGAINGLAGAFTILEGRMRSRAIAEVKAEIRELQEDMNRLGREKGGIFRRLKNELTGTLVDPETSARAEVVFRKLAAAKMRLRELQAGAPGSLTGGKATSPGGFADLSGGMAVNEAADYNKRLIDMIRDLRIQAIADEQRRAFAAIDEKYRREVEVAKKAGGDLALVHQAWEQERLNLTADFAQRRADEEAAVAQERAMAQQELDRQLARAAINARFQGAERERKLLEQERREAMQDAAAQGLDLGKVAKLFDLKGAALGVKEGIAASTGPRGTFSGRAVELLGGGRNPLQRMEHLEERVAKGVEFLADRARLGAMRWGV